VKQTALRTRILDLRHPSWDRELAEASHWFRAVIFLCASALLHDSMCASFNILPHKYMFPTGCVCLFPRTVRSRRDSPNVLTHLSHDLSLRWHHVLECIMFTLLVSQLQLVIARMCVTAIFRDFCDPIVLLMGTIETASGARAERSLMSEWVCESVCFRGLLSVFLPSVAIVRAGCDWLCDLAGGA
jgi:hypothetical protein